jgi:prepilin-type N-terminal cleavage/methylation domain-containing protein
MIKNQRGNSLIEIIVAIAIVLIAFTATMSFVLNIKKDTQKLLTSRSRSIQLQKIVQLLIADPKLFKVNFNISEAARCAALKTEDLPLGWNDNSINEVDKCVGCQGRLGYVIQPFPLATIRGVYLVTIHLTHPKLTKESIAICNGETLAGVQEIQMIVSLR